MHKGISEGNGSPFLTPLLSFLSISNVMLQKINLQKDFSANIFDLETIGMNEFMYVSNWLLLNTCFL